MEQLHTSSPGVVVCGGAELSELVTDAKVSAEEAMECVERLAAVAGATSFVVMPNFGFSRLSGPRGFSATLPEMGPFTPDIFLAGSGDRYRFVAGAEVSMKSPWTPAVSATAEQRLRRCIPVTSRCPPTRFDRVGSGWAPCLDRHGSWVGVFSTEEVNHDTNERFPRYFIICNSSLPQQSIDELFAEELKAS